jgi:hypothetical protein
MSVISNDDQHMRPGLWRWVTASAGVYNVDTVGTAGGAGLTHSTQHTHHTNQLTRYYPIGYAPTSPSTPVVIVALRAQNIL